MKKALLYLLLFSYTVIICRPVLPSVADAMAHIFWYSAHMATVHYEHGKYHVHYEYRQAAKKESPATGNSIPQSSGAASEHLAITPVCLSVARPAGTAHFPPPLQRLFCTILDSDIPPPRA